MKMTLRDAKYCFEATEEEYINCKFYNSDEIYCKKEATDIAINAMNYLLIGQKLSTEIDEKER